MSGIGIEVCRDTYAYLHPGVETTVHGSKCMEVIDPFGNRIRFDEKLPTATV